MTLLEANGSRINTPVLRKRVKDDVCWDNAALPWRRSPFWLVLRVCTQRLLYLRLGAALGRIQYTFLMCSLMAQLLEDSVNQLSPEQCNFLKTKLCGRLAKLEIDSSAAVRDACIRLFASIGPLCQKSIDVATSSSESKWNSFKREFRRTIPLLPLHAQDDDLHLRLPKSSSYLQKILYLAQHRRPRNQQPADPGVPEPNAGTNTSERFEKFTMQYSSLAEMELAIESEVREVPTSKIQCDALCRDLARRIENYLRAVEKAYMSDLEQMSVFILSIFELWVHMDKCAAVAVHMKREGL